MWDEARVNRRRGKPSHPYPETPGFSVDMGPFDPYTDGVLTALLGGPPKLLFRRLRQLALFASVSIVVQKSAQIHAFCCAEPTPVDGPAPLAVGDQDHDGLSDTEEAALARRFAPILVLDAGDPHQPASIEWLLARADIFRQDSKPLLAGSAEFGPGGLTARLPAQVHTGSSDRRDWVTYAHVYPNADGGINLQYWFFYAYSNGPLFFDHDSDWEHLTVELDPNGKPRGVHLAQHEDDHPGRFYAWYQVRTFEGQPVFYSAHGTHATYAHPEDVAWFERRPACAEPSRCMDHLWRTWEGGGIENLGERKQPLRPNRALLYRGRWGGSGLLPGTSAPFGPLHHRGFCAQGARGC